MSVAAARECTPDFVSAHAGKFFTFTRDTAAALLRAVAVAAEGEDIETPCRPRPIGTDASVAADTGIRKEIATILAIRREARVQRVRDGKHDHRRGRIAGCLLVKAAKLN